MTLAFWEWWVLGLALLVAEMLIPTGFFLIWIGVAAGLTGVLAWAVPTLAWQAQALLFGTLSLASFFLWRRLRPALTASDRPTLNRRGESYVGRSFRLEEPLVDGVGRLRVDDSQWRVSGPDLPAGAHVRVIASDGATLKVAPHGSDPAA